MATLMKRLPAIFSLSFAMLQLIFSGVALAQVNELPTKAISRSVHGTVEYSSGDQWLELKVNQSLNPGTTIRTSSNSECYLQVNGFTSTVKLEAGTMLLLQKMNALGGGSNADTQTILNLKSGTILGKVKKLSAGSSYEIHTPNGTAKIRGTDFQISAEPLASGACRVTFTCVTGMIICSATVEGKSVTQILLDGQHWTPGEPVSAGPTFAETPAARPPRYSGKELQNIQQLAAHYNSFGFQLFEATRKSHPKQNSFISPPGVGITLSMIQNGAQGPTRREITRALGVDSITPAEIGSGNKLLIGQLSSLDPNLRLEIANSLWVEHAFPVKAGFVSQARDFYDAEVATLDFGNPAAVGEVNSWASRHTHGVIPAILDSLDDQAALVAVNAVYFKGLWVDEFQKTSTSNQPFKLTDGTKISHPRMSQSGMFPYYETRSFQLISLPYRGGARMDILLPKGALNSILNGLTFRQWQGWISDMHDCSGLIELPRFKIENEYDFKAPLASLGVRRAFDRKMADFSQIADSTSPGAYVGQFKQKTYVDVDEEGTVAAAVTGAPVLAGLDKKPPPPPFQMIVDHPFFVVIREDSTGAILFMGAILDPR
jgi:serine protease inhibitor